MLESLLYFNTQGKQNDYPPPPHDRAVFKQRYIEHNTWYLKEYIHNSDFSKSSKLIKHSLFSALPLLYGLIKLQKKWQKGEKYIYKILRRYFRIRAALGKVDIPYFELVLTTKCTLRCESCNNLMQYFHPKNQYTCTIEGIISSLDTLFNAVDSIQSIRIIGGEPLLFKDINKVIAYLGKQKKLLSFNIVTNGTLLFKEEALSALKASSNVKVCISDYSVSPNISVPLKTNALINQLKEHKIPYEIYWNKEGAAWWNPGKIYKRGRQKEDIIRNFKACMMPCVSLMSNEGIKRGDTDSQGEYEIAPNGALFVCPIASSLSRLRGLKEFEGDFINLSSPNLRKRILEFYGQSFFKACDYCHDMWEKKQSIPIAVQTDRIFQLQKDSQ